MNGPPPGQAFTKRLWPEGVAIPEGWELSEAITAVISLTHPDFVVIVGWFDPTWHEGSAPGRP